MYLNKSNFDIQKPIGFRSNLYSFPRKAESCTRDILYNLTEFFSPVLIYEGSYFLFIYFFPQSGKESSICQLKNIILHFRADQAVVSLPPKTN